MTNPDLRKKAGPPASSDEQRTRAAAMHGSQRLKLMMERAFDMLAVAHDLTFEDARLMLMNGVMPR